MIYEASGTITKVITPPPTKHGIPRVLLVVLLHEEDGRSSVFTGFGRDITAGLYPGLNVSIEFDLSHFITPDGKRTYPVLNITKIQTT